MLHDGRDGKSPVVEASAPRRLTECLESVHEQLSCLCVFVPYCLVCSVGQFSVGDGEYQLLVSSLGA
jgi:hypothetical protein